MLGSETHLLIRHDQVPRNDDAYSRCHWLHPHSPGSANIRRLHREQSHRRAGHQLPRPSAQANTGQKAWWLHDQANSSRVWSQVKEVVKTSSGSLTLKLDSGAEMGDVDCLLFAIGRKPNTDWLNLQATVATKSHPCLPKMGDWGWVRRGWRWTRAGTWWRTPTRTPPSTASTPSATSAASSSSRPVLQGRL